ncbi:MAG: sialidase family protein [Planctomycetota bacterium]|jgi:hypothetical protein
MSHANGRRLRLTGAFLAPLVGISMPAGQATPRDPAAGEPPLRLEVPDDPPGEPAGPLGLAAPAAPVRLGPFASIQVNVSELGSNIPGDAANEPSIAVDPTAPNRMAIGWRQFDTVNSNFREAGWAYTNDGGRTWTFPGVLENNVFRSDPVLGADSDGVFYYYSLTGNFLCDMFTSTDGGANWIGPFDAFGGDKAWMAIDTTGGLGEGNVYCQWTPGLGCCGDNVFIRSTDEGQTFSDPVQISGDPQWGSSTVGPDGTVHVVGRAGSSGSPLAFSINAQDSNQVPSFQHVTVSVGGTTSAFTGPNPEGLLGQMWVDLDHSNGNIYLVGSVNPPGSDPQDVHAVRSTDGGATWSSPVRVNDDPTNNGAWQWFGTMSVAPNGRIDVVWLDTRHDPPDQLSELFYSSSTDAGVSWSVNIALGPPFNHSVGYPQQNKLGDYYHMRSDDVGADLAYAATYNGEQDVYYLRIGDYDCNRNGVGDEEDVDLGTSPDCNGNGIPDECEIAAGAVEDEDGNGIPDECDCPWDCDGAGNGTVGIGDLLALLAQWGGPGPCDFDGGGVGIADLLALLANWGGCP